MWLYLPAISASSAEPQVLSSPSELLCQTLAASATSRGKSRRQKFWSRALRTRLLTTRLSGLTSPPSTVSRGVDLWMESLAASHVQTSLSQENAPESSGAIAADSSSNMAASFGKLNPDGSISKTSQQSSLFQQEELFSESLPPWGLMRSGELYERPTWVPAIAGTASSSWPTADAQVMNDGESSETFLTRQARQKAKGINGNGFGLTLAMAAQLWPTVSVDGLHNRVGVTETSGDGLSTAAKLWTTPQAHDSGQGDAARVGRYATEHGGKNLADDVMLWSTPHTSISTGPGTSGRDGGENLQTQVHMWSTPNVPNGGRSLTDEQVASRGQTEKGKRQVGLENEASRDWKDGDCSQADVETNGLLGRQVVEWAYSPLGLQMSDGPMCWCGTPGCVLRSHRRKLNPLFVEWLMGWPLFWTDASIALEPAAMEWYLFRARLLLESLCDAREVVMFERVQMVENL